MHLEGHISDLGEEHGPFPGFPDLSERLLMHAIGEISLGSERVIPYHKVEIIFPVGGTKLLISMLC